MGFMRFWFIRHSGTWIQSIVYIKPPTPPTPPTPPAPSFARAHHINIEWSCRELYKYTGKYIVYPMKYVHGFVVLCHYNDVIMSAMASQITSLTIIYSIVHSGADQRQHQSSASLAFVRGVHRWPVNSPHKGPVTRKIWWRHHVLFWLCHQFLFDSFTHIFQSYSEFIILTHILQVCFTGTGAIVWFP